MPTIKVHLDLPNYRKLAQIAVRERRPICMQAEVELVRALGLDVVTRLRPRLDEALGEPPTVDLEGLGHAQQG